MVSRCQIYLIPRGQFPRESKKFFFSPMENDPIQEPLLGSPTTTTTTTSTTTTSSKVEDVTPPIKKAAPQRKVLLITTGTRGDVQPFLAFGSELRKDGWRVGMVTHKAFYEFATQNKEHLDVF